MCTDGTPVNVKMQNLIITELGEHYLLTLCPVHIIELVIQDAFKSSDLNNKCNTVLTYFITLKIKLKMEGFEEKLNKQGNTLYSI